MITLASKLIPLSKPSFLDNIKDSIMHYANITEINKDYKSHTTSHLAKTDLDPTLFDFGSGLACTRDKVNFYLKGVYIKLLKTGYIQFFKVDYEWISYLFKSGFSAKQEGRAAGLGIITGTNASAVISDLNLGNFYGAFFKKGNTTIVSTFGSCPFPAIRRYVRLQNFERKKSINISCRILYQLLNSLEKPISKNSLGKSWFYKNPPTQFFVVVL